MTRTECVITIGDILVQIDTLRGSISPDMQERTVLDEIRDRLDRIQAQLSREVFDANTTAWQDAANGVAQLNTAVNRTINDMARSASMFEAIKKSVFTIDSLFQLAAKTV